MPPARSTGSDPPPAGDELIDPESAPSLPSTTLASQAAPHPQERPLLASIPMGGVTAEILRLSWPVMLAQAAVTFAGIIDRAMVGRLHDDGGAAIPLAAVGLASQFFFLVQSSLFAVGLSCVALMARAIGAEDPRRAQLAFGASIRVGVVSSFAMSALIAVFARPALAFLGTEPEVIDAAIPYLNYVLGSSVMLAAALVIENAMRANRDMRSPMRIAMLVTIAKLGLNWLLIFGNWGFPRLELVGAGLATLISQALGLGLLGWAIFGLQKGSPLALRSADWLRPNPQSSDVLRIALPGIAERLVMNIAMLSYIWVLGRHYGTLAVAAYTVGIPLLAFSWIPGQSYAQAVATMSGQSLGARDPERAMRIGWRASALAVGTATALGIAVGWGRYPLARMLTTDLTVVEALGPFMLALAIAQPFLQLQFTLGGAHRGAGDTWTPLLAACLGNWVFRIPLAILFGVWLEWRIEWVWYALIFDHLARCVVLGWSFRRGRWMDRLEPTESASRG